MDVVPRAAPARRGAASAAGASPGAAVRSRFRASPARRRRAGRDRRDARRMPRATPPPCGPSARGLLAALRRAGRRSTTRRASGCAARAEAAAARPRCSAEREAAARAGAAARPPRRRAHAGLPRAVRRRAGRKQRAVRRARRGPHQGGRRRARPATPPSATRPIGALLDPVSAALQRVEGQLRDVERERQSAYVGLREQVERDARSSEQLQYETKSLVNALRAPQVRGRWGELQLERIVQLAGMVEHCDFSTQVTAAATDGAVRPDMVVHLAGGKSIVVDAKVPFAAYLEAVESRDPDTHARPARRPRPPAARARRRAVGQGVLGGVRADAGVRGAVRARRPVPRGRAAGRPGSAGARVRPQRRRRHARRR